MKHKILEGKKGIIFGALDDQSIAWKTAESVADAGGKFVLTNAPVALRMGTINLLAEKTGSKVIAADATSIDDLNSLIDQAQEILGGNLDFVLHSIGMSVNVRKGKHYTDLNHDWMEKSSCQYYFSVSNSYNSWKRSSRFRWFFELCRENVSIR